MFRFAHVGDPHGVASLAKAAIKQLKPAAPILEKHVAKSETRTTHTDSIVCNQCGNVNAKDAKFCNKCGKVLSSVCPKCQKVNAQGASFCAECGLPLS
jgi:ribosomal protein L40E